MRALAIALALVTTAAGASPVGWDEETGHPIFHLDDAPSTTIYNGTRSVAGEFGPMGWIGNCTGTLVADNVIITAAHCTRTGARITYTNRETGQGIAATCTIHPRYNDRTVYNDYALCKLDTALPAAQKVAVDMVTGVQSGQRMLLNGFGAPNVRVHHWGSASVRSINGQDIVTCGPSNLGGGDSGGSLLTWSDDRTKSAKFTVVGINSRAGGGCSYFNRLNHSEFVSWVKQYEVDKSVKICGVSRSDCHGPPPMLCPGIEGHIAKLGKCVKREAGREECEAALKATDECRKVVAP